MDASCAPCRFHGSFQPSEPLPPCTLLPLPAMFPPFPLLATFPPFPPLAAFLPCRPFPLLPVFPAVTSAFTPTIRSFRAPPLVIPVTPVPTGFAPPLPSATFVVPTG